MKASTLISRTVRVQRVGKSTVFDFSLEIQLRKRCSVI